MFLNFMNDVDDYELRKIDKILPEDNGGIGVSTAYTSDEGYETALMDVEGTHPVDRYQTVEEAKVGHQKWLNFSKSAHGKMIRKLGWTGMGMDEDVKLCRVE